jgi:hypothetical protein
MAKKNHELIRSLRVLKQQLNRDIENKGAECEVYARDGERPTWHANAYGHLQGLKLALCYVEGQLERAET